MHESDAFQTGLAFFIVTGFLVDIVEAQVGMVRGWEPPSLRLDTINYNAFPLPPGGRARTREGKNEGRGGKGRRWRRGEGREGEGAEVVPKLRATQTQSASEL
jgi:hypothetical protein